MPDVARISSRSNALVKDLRRLAQGKTDARDRRLWVEGDHLATAALAQGWQPSMLVCGESAWPGMNRQWTAGAGRVVVLSDALMAAVSALKSPAGVALVFDLPPEPQLQPLAATVVLDRVQDAGNVGSILRSAAAFGFRQVVAIEGTARLWSPKVVRAGMGAHFGLSLVEVRDAAGLQALHVPMLTTSSHEGELLHTTTLPWPCAWVFGNEGQGVDAALMTRSAQQVRITQPGGQESLGVAAAAAICLHASAAQASGQAIPTY